MVNNPPANVGDTGLILGSGRSPGGGNGNPFHFLPVESSGQRSLVDYRSMRSQRVGHDLAAEQQQIIKGRECSTRMCTVQLQSTRDCPSNWDIFSN